MEKWWGEEVIMSELRTLSIDNCEKIGQGFAGAVYALDDKKIVKVAYGADAATIQKRMSHELTIAQELVRCGIPTPQAYEMVSVDGSVGIIYERLAGDDISDYLEAHPDEMDDISSKVSAILKKLHRTTPHIGGLPKMKETLLSFLPRMASLYTDEELSVIRTDYEQIPDSDTFVHGDTNPGNFMRLSDGTLRIIDMGSVSVGHPYFEFENMYPAYLMLDDIAYGRDEAYAYFEKVMGKPDAAGVQRQIDLMRVYYDKLLHSYFSELSDDEQEGMIRRIRILVYQKMIPFYDRRLPLADERAKQEQLQKIKEKYFSEKKTVPPVAEWWKIVEK